MATLTLQPDEAAGCDTWYNLSAPDTAYPTSAYIEVNGYSLVLTFGLLKFDLSGLPAGAVINSAKLYLYGSGGFYGGVINLNRILPANSGWTEAATWNHKDGASAHWAGDTAGNHGADAGCSVSGTDYSGTLLGSATFAQADNAETEFVLDATEFGLMIANNQGIILRSGSASNYNYQPASSSDSTASSRPKLVVDYTAGCPKMTNHLLQMLKA